MGMTAVTTSATFHARKKPNKMPPIAMPMPWKIMYDGKSRDL